MKKHRLFFLVYPWLTLPHDVKKPDSKREKASPLEPKNVKSGGLRFHWNQVKGMDGRRLG
jgi:hypothetical protein